ncbi:ATP-binding cassette domain-containing protein [Mucilaginibacter sp. RS28]|uniref:ATP-binding cassette domain-containing protein n=1 Tax=Mucilaginibacter straminoryzae TaxID=2932774 RepID=A0A9X1X1M4_9SPHI|nr:ATP-binding cassette domain-containing protein [Mucilaginibacter straminoryzae]MCJ8208345.1 ATP-binding cassette domain-containing protein [Mucilaginibacter straminoryzae]
METTTYPSAVTETQAEQALIEISHVFKSFGDNKVLKDFSITLGKEENLVVLGKSGSGKSVLIKCIIGLLKPDKGTVKVFGDDVAQMDHQQLDRLRARVGFLFQSNALYDSMTVRENLEFSLRRHWLEVTEAEVEDMVKEALENVGLAYTAQMMPAELSGGMAKRIALARTMILKPEIILYDEPTSGLDPVTAREIDELIVKLQRKYHTSSIIISHDMKCVKKTADRVALLLNGQCYITGSYDELESAEDNNIKQFFE